MCSTLETIHFVGIFTEKPRRIIGPSANKSGRPSVVNLKVLLFFSILFPLAYTAAKASFSDENISFNYNNPTFEQTKKFTKAECEKAIQDGVIKVDNISVLEWGPYSTVMKKVKELNGNLSRAENQAGAALAWKFLVRDNRTLFNDPEFVRGIKDSLIRFCDIQLSNRNIDKVCADRFNAMKEVISKL